ncbi:MAG: hypothetical protein JWQ98_3253 [Chlorobi bacterium]|nr:hypothetical protein [Chlorobiota bacterium]
MGGVVMLAPVGLGSRMPDMTLSIIHSIST